MHAGRMTAALAVLPLAALLVACSDGKISEPWVPEYKKSLVSEERERAQQVAEQLDHRLRYTQVDR